MRRSRTVSRRADRRRAPPLEPSLGRGFEALYGCELLAMATLSRDGYFLKANGALQRMLGYSEDELRARTFDEVTYAADVPACRELFRQVQGEVIDNFEMEKRYVHKSGRLVWAYVIVAAVRTGRRLEHTVGVAIDVTARKRTEDALRESEEKYRSLYARAPAMLFSLDLDGRISSVSDRWLEGLGCTREKAVGRLFADFLTSDSRRYLVEAVLPELSKTGACAELPLQVVKSSGETLDTALSAAVEGRAGQGPARAMAVLTDVTQRRQAEEKVWRLTVTLEESVRQRTAELELRNALLAAQAEASPDSIYVVDENRRILWWNKRCTEIWGLTPEVIASRSDRIAMRLAMRQVVSPPGLRENVERLYASRDLELRQEVILIGDRTVEIDTRPLRGSDGAYLGRVWFSRDETRRARAEKALRESNADLESFASTAAHDLLSPIRKISAFSEMLRARADGALAPDQLKLLERISKSASGLSRLVLDILALSRVGRENLPLEDVDLGAAASQVLSDLELAIKESSAEVKVGPMPVVRADAASMRRVLQNLIGNALKFRRPDAPLRVSVSSRKMMDGGVEVSVEDNGIGFDSARGEEIFEPFRRLNPVGTYEGSGLGLSICRRVAQRYGGSVRASGRPGAGSTFTLTLPKSAVVRPPEETA